MKIAVLLRGISSGHGKAGFLKCAENIKENIIEPLKQKYHTNTYICTYEHTRINELRDCYNPKKLITLPFEGSNQITTVKSALEMLKDEDIDFIFVVRFDTKFKHKFLEENVEVDYNKINFLYPPHEPWLDYQFVSDLFFMLPKKHLTEMFNSLDWLLANPPRSCIDLHGIYVAVKKFLKEDDINFLYNYHLKFNHWVELVR